MEIALTWNLVLISAFVMLFAYHFLLGPSATIKLMLSIYISILTADGVAGLLKKFAFEASPGLQNIFGTIELEIFSAIRIVLLLFAVVVLVVKSNFHVAMERHDHWGVRIGIHSVFSMLSAILFLATILIYISGSSFVEGMLFAREIMIYEESLIAQVLIDYYQFWFSLPALAFLVISFFFKSKE